MDAMYYKTPTVRSMLWSFLSQNGICPAGTNLSEAYAICKEECMQKKIKVGNRMVMHFESNSLNAVMESLKTRLPEKTCSNCSYITCPRKEL